MGLLGLLICTGRPGWGLGGGHGSQSLVIILQWCGSNSGKHALIQRASDLQFVLDHVKGVIGKVHLLNAVNDLLLRLWVDGLLPQLPQLLLKVRERGEE